MMCCSSVWNLCVVKLVWWMSFECVSKIFLVVGDAFSLGVTYVAYADK